jgi:hypothetical protein
VKCSRWKELTTSLLFHAEVAHRGCIASEFRFLNNGAPCEIGFDLSQSSTDFNRLKSILTDGSPNGVTPLCRHINEVAEKIRQLTPALLKAGKKAMIVIATDGQASDGDIRNALRPLKHLPVWLLLRFCTDDEKVISYWNRIDLELELNMDVIDDFFGESQEIHKLNPWFTYGEPLHRIREFGVTLKELDNIDEKPLSSEERLKVCQLCLGRVVESFPPPQIELKGFLRELERANMLIPRVWSSITEKNESWINTQELKKTFTPAPPALADCCIIC